VFTLTTSDKNMQGGYSRIIDQLEHQRGAQHARSSCEENLTPIESLFNNAPLGYHDAGV
jgi:hypothetical protein